MAVSALELIGEAIEALTRADAARLRRLAEEAQQAEIPRAEPELRFVVERQKTLARLLALTRRNLRLLRGSGRDPGGYGAARH